MYRTPEQREAIKRAYAIRGKWSKQKVKFVKAINAVILDKNIEDSEKLKQIQNIIFE